MCSSHIGSKLCIILLVIGGLNWGLIGIFNFNFVDFVFGTASVFTRITYIVVGLAALYVAVRSPALMMSNSEETGGHPAA